MAATVNTDYHYFYFYAVFIIEFYGLTANAGPDIAGRIRRGGHCKIEQR